MNVKMTFTIPEEIADKLRCSVKRSKRSAFVAGAVQARLRWIDEEDRRRRLIEAYTDRYDEDKAMNEEWEAATLERWPRY